MKSTENLLIVLKFLWNILKSQVVKMSAELNLNFVNLLSACINSRINKCTNTIPRKGFFGGSMHLKENKITSKDRVLQYSHSIDSAILDFWLRFCSTYFTHDPFWAARPILRTFSHYFYLLLFILYIVKEAFLGANIYWAFSIRV